MIDIYNKRLKFIAHFFCKEDLQIKNVEIWAHKDISYTVDTVDTVY